jgi:indole-3-glycerol phosphate synthase
MPANLDAILAATRRRLAQAKQRADVRELEGAAERHRPRGFGHALRTAAQSRPAVIAELKKASPSKGVIRGDLDAARFARELAEAGACALSVLTDEEFFQGSLENLRAASAATPLPCLRKDFIVDEFQLLQSRAHCADAVLLIAAALEQRELRALHARAQALELDVVAEVHNSQELARVLEAGCDIVGVNSRDLRSFHVDLETPLRLARLLPEHVLRIAESGIHSGGDIRKLRNAGYGAFLIGESLMKAQSPAAALRQLLAVAAEAEPDHLAAARHEN